MLNTSDYCVHTLNTTPKKKKNQFQSKTLNPKNTFTKETSCIKIKLPTKDESNVMIVHVLIWG